MKNKIKQGTKRVITELAGMIKVYLKMLSHYMIHHDSHTKPHKLGENIVLLGNGPSSQLYTDNMDKFVDYDLLVVNFYPIKSEHFWINKPKYLALIDPAFFYTGDGFLHERHKKVYDDIQKLYQILERVDWGLNIVVTGDYRLPIQNKNIQYISLASVDAPIWNEHIIKLFYKNNVLPPRQNVLVHAVCFAEIFGYKEIALFGIEQNWLNFLYIDKNNKLYSETKYFYGTVKTEINSTYLLEIKDVERTMEGFDITKKLAKKKRINIINYTVNSYVQCFEKRTL